MKLHNLLLVEMSCILKHAEKSETLIHIESFGVVGGGHSFLGELREIAVYPATLKKTKAPM